MKNKVLVPLICLAAFLVMSCSKEYNCHCELYNSQDDTTWDHGVTTIKARNPSDAQVKCNSEEDGYGYDYLTETCEITGEK